MKLLSFGEICWDLCGEEKTLGGAPLNLAAHAAIQGSEAYLLSAVGKDFLGNEALTQISAMGVKTDYISRHPEWVTGQCHVTVDPKGLPHYRIPDRLSYDQIAFPSRPIENFDVIAFGTLSLRSEHNRRILLRLLKEHSFSEIYTDLNIRPPFYSKESIELCLSHATIVKLSDEELPLIAQEMQYETVSENDSILWIGKQYPHIRLILLSKGSDGAVGYDIKSGETVTVPAVQTQAVSTVGAGDSFGATFLCEYLKTGDLRHSMSRAASVSAFVVSRQGSVPADMRAFLSTLSP